ncbi:MAG: DNA-directed RNA polymerase subunit RpoH/Rpb5 C-terminal domain-containing protein [Candidatus Woesearchaeota archaeon]
MKEKITHNLIPEHTIVSDKEKFLEEHNITFEKLPKISVKDPAIQHLDVTVGDVIMIKRDSLTAGNSLFYRGVINE